MADFEANIALAEKIKEQAVSRMAFTEFPLRNEPQAFKRACLRAGYEMALGFVNADEINASELMSAEAQTIMRASIMLEEAKHSGDDGRRSRLFSLVADLKWAFPDAEAELRRRLGAT